MANKKMKISDEKINSIDNLINLYKKSNEDLNLELDRIKLSRKAEKEERFGVVRSNHANNGCLYKYTLPLW